MRDRPEDQVDVLLVDDDDEDFLLTKDLLSRLDSVRYECQRAGDYQEALKAAGERRYDVCLVDYRLGPDNGIELVRELIANGHDMPIIVLTGQGDHDVDVEAAEAGAADYLVKGEISPGLLERTIRYAIHRHADMRALRESEDDLRQAQRMEAIGQLAGGVAHDFNNIMTAVIGFSELALRRLDDGRELPRHYLEEIKRAGERAAATAHQLLAFSRKQVLQTRVLNINGIVGEIEQLLKQLLADDVALVTVLDPTLGPVEADPGQIELVIMNLAINASDAMPSGGKLMIETANVELDESHTSRYIDVAPGPYVLLAVTDSGVGMDTETAHRIFEPFFTTKDIGKGTGLGLSTVFGIVKQSGGDIGVYSEPGQGTTFKIYLPRVQALVDQPEDHGPQRESPRGSETILLTDDEGLVRGFEREVLTELGYTVLEADSPRHALELARDHPSVIHLLLTDVVMPELSGRELSEQLAEKRPELKTLYTSGYATGAIVHHGILEPGFAFLPKPLNRTSLAHKVREVLDSPATGPSETARTILVVDDNELVREVVRLFAESAGYTTVEASTGAEAFAAARQHRAIDILLTDLKLPDMSGVEVAKVLSQLHPATRILYMSGHGTLDGPGAFIAKPFSEDQLTEALNALSARPPSEER
ncbi:MAG TPA: response regulator [Gaiellaceae bacterium]|nr:response regulator [Gaiellaceae bacterium]